MNSFFANLCDPHPNPPHKGEGKISFLRRSIILSPLLLAATELPYKVRFIAGQKAGDRFTAGLHISMSKGWKTYWRVPGAGGVPPQIEVRGDNVKSFKVDLPAPQRFQGADGESLGFKDDVVFPITIETKSPAQELQVSLSAFVGVCDEVCIPVPVEVAMTLQENANEAALIMRSNDVIPKLVADGPISNVIASDKGLQFKLSAPLQDIFVEAGDTFYVKQPEFGFDGLHGTMALAGSKSALDLKGKMLRITMIDAGGGALEQMLRVE